MKRQPSEGGYRGVVKVWKEMGILGTNDFLAEVGKIGMEFVEEKRLFLEKELGVCLPRGNGRRLFLRFLLDGQWKGSSGRQGSGAGFTGPDVIREPVR